MKFSSVLRWTLMATALLLTPTLLLALTACGNQTPAGGETVTSSEPPDPPETAPEDFLVRVADALLNTVPATEGTLRLSDVQPPADDGSTFVDSLAVAVNGVTDYAVLGLADPAGRMAPNTYGDILLSLSQPVAGDQTPYVREDWALAVPAYQTGRLATNMYEIGSGLENDNKADTWSNGRMAVIRDVSEVLRRNTPGDLGMNRAISPAYTTIGP